MAAVLAHVCRRRTVGARSYVKRDVCGHAVRRLPPSTTQRRNTLRYEVTAGLTPREALEQAAAYFGHGGVGLHAVSQTLHSLVFQGGGGHGAITVQLGVFLHNLSHPACAMRGVMQKRPTWRHHDPGLESWEWDVAVQ